MINPNNISVIKKNCLRCNSLIEIKWNKNANQRYCENCRKIHKQEYNKLWKERNPSYFEQKSKEQWANNKETMKLKSKAYHQKNRNEILKRLRDYRENNKEYFKRKWQEYYLKNKDKLSEKKRIWNEAHKEYNKIMSKSYYQSQRGREVMRFQNKQRKARIRNIIHDFSRDDWRKMVEETNGICPKCKKYVGINNLTLDHILPISKAHKGQHYSIDMVQPLCFVCNSKKNDKFTKDEVMELFGRLTDYNEEDTKDLLKVVYDFLLEYEKNLQFTNDKPQSI